MEIVKMNEKQIKERKDYLALQAFYLKLKELLEELEKKLNQEPQKSTELKDDFQA